MSFPHIEISQLICCVNHLTGFYIRATMAFNGLNQCGTNEITLLENSNVSNIFQTLVTFGTITLKIFLYFRQMFAEYA